jgi:hypothetical protein
MVEKQFKIQVAFMVCRSCGWIMEVTRGDFFTCTNQKCEDLFKYFRIHTTVSEVPTQQAMGDSIPGVKEEKESDG